MISRARLFTFNARSRSIQTLPWPMRRLALLTTTSGSPASERSSHRKRTSCGIAPVNARGFILTLTTISSFRATWKRPRKRTQCGRKLIRATKFPTQISARSTQLWDAAKALAESQEAFRLNPSGLNYTNLVTAFMSLNRLDEARVTAEDAQAKKLDSPYLRAALYQLAFLKNDAAVMAQHLKWASGKPGIEDALLAMEADSVAYAGQLRKADDYTRQAVASATRADEKETAASYEAQAGLRHALFGNVPAARQHATAALAMSNGRDVQFMSALALAFAGDGARVQTLENDFAKRFPGDTMVKFIYLPTLRAQQEILLRDSSESCRRVAASCSLRIGADKRWRDNIRGSISSLYPRRGFPCRQTGQRSRRRVSENPGSPGCRNQRTAGRACASRHRPCLRAFR